MSSSWPHISARRRGHGGRALALHRLTGLVIVFYLYLHLAVRSRLLGGCRCRGQVTLGIRSAFSRPRASLATAAVIASGLAAAVLAVGLNSQMLELVVGATTPQNGVVITGQALVRRLTVRCRGSSPRPE